MKISKEMGSNYQLLFLAHFHHLGGGGGEEKSKGNHTKEICEKTHHYCQIRSNSSCG
jgi:hypothetical protein